MFVSEVRRILASAFDTTRDEMEWKSALDGRLKLYQYTHTLERHMTPAFP